MKEYKAGDKFKCTETLTDAWDSNRVLFKEGEIAVLESVEQDYGYTGDVLERVFFNTEKHLGVFPEFVADVATFKHYFVPTKG